ncbi:alpha/beta fold hydrolase [Cohaesibacter celericrescens]|uniref:alpha/beta fold hydrolase n=1 Tax=Cohaesibacter celericrescens TaxID=2067669 RepID=UPI0035632A09
MYLRNIEKYPDLADGRCSAITSWDGHKIRTATWPALVGTPKGTICLLQGRAEFIEKYYEVIQDLRKRGFSVATFDWRGQGASDRLLPDPLKGHVRHFSDYGKDLDQFLKEIALPDCPPPHFGLAHSMGALILLTRLPRLRAVLERTLLSTPLIEIAQQQRVLAGKDLSQSTIKNSAAFLRMIGRGRKFMLSVSRSPFDRLGFETNSLTSDGPRYDRNRQYMKDFPELAIAGPTAQWLHEACTAMDHLQSSEFQSTIHTPSLIVTAGNDSITNPNSAEYFAATTRAVHSVTIPGSRHEIMMERHILREQFWAAFDSFIPGENRPIRNTPD